MVREASAGRLMLTAAGLAMAILARAAAAQAPSPSPRAIPSGPTSGPLMNADSARVAETVSRFHARMLAADSAGVLALLDRELVVLESGGYETLAEFSAHHLPADIAFARATRTERRLRAVVVQGDAAWVSSTSVTEGEFRGRPIDSAGAELMVLRRVGDLWKIAAIHWSSRPRRR